MIDEIVINDPNSLSSNASSIPSLDELPVTEVGAIEEVIAEEKEDRIIPVSSLPSLINQPLTVDIPDNLITSTGVTEIRNYIANQYYNTHYSICFSLAPRSTEGQSTPEEQFSWSWLDPKHGTLPKRMRRWLRKKLKAEPDPKIIAEIGNIARRNSESTSSYYFEISDKIDWSTTQFGQADNGSCWWGRGSNGHWPIPNSNSYCNDFLAEKGLVIKFFKSNEDRSNSNGIGRAWLAISSNPDYYGTNPGDWAILFNGYWNGQGATQRLSRVLAAWMGLGYMRIGVSCDRYYVNRDSGFLIGEQNVIQQLHVKVLNRSSAEPQTAVIDIPRKEPMQECLNCLATKPKSGFRILIRYSADGERMVADQSVCSDCYIALKTECNNCCKVYNKQLVVMTTIQRISWHGDYDRYYCPSCMKNVVTCAGPCQRLFDPATGSSYRGGEGYGHNVVDGQDVCCQCYNSKLVARCSSCRVKTMNPAWQEGVKVLCQKCEDRFELEIALPEIDPITDRIRVKVDQEHHGYSAESDLNDPWYGCQCARCRMRRTYHGDTYIKYNLNIDSEGYLVEPDSTIPNQLELQSVLQPVAAGEFEYVRASIPLPIQAEEVLDIFEDEDGDDVAF